MFDFVKSCWKRLALEEVVDRVFGDTTFGADGRSSLVDDGAI